MFSGLKNMLTKTNPESGVSNLERSPQDPFVTSIFSDLINHVLTRKRAHIILALSLLIKNLT
jgi:hypothetical protein